MSITSLQISTQNRLTLGILSNPSRNCVEVRTLWDYTELIHLFITDITHFLDNKQLYLLMGCYSICLCRRELLYIGIVMTRYKIIVCQRESCKYFDAKFWEADVLPLPPKNHYKMSSVGAEMRGREILQTVQPSPQ